MISRLLMWLVLGTSLLIVALVSYLSLADLNWLKPRIESMVAARSDFQLSLQGELALDILPDPALLVEDVQLSRTNTEAGDLSVKLGHLSARLQLASVLSGPLLVEELRVHDLNIDITAGTADPLEETEADSPGDAPSSRIPVVVQFAELSNIRLHAVPREGEPLAAGIDTLTITRDDGGYLVLDGRGELDELPVTLSANVGPDKALRRGEAITLDLDADLGHATVAAKGGVTRLKDLSGTDIDLQVSTQDVAPILKRFAVELPLAGAFDSQLKITDADPGLRFELEATLADLALTGSATRHEDGLQFQATIPHLDRVGRAFAVKGLPADTLKLAGGLGSDDGAMLVQDVNASLAGVEIALNGRVGPAASDAQLHITAVTDNVSGLKETLPTIPINVDLNAEVAPGVTKLRDIKLKVADSDLVGDLWISTGKRTSIRGEIRSDLLDLTPLRGEKTDPAGQEQAKAKEIEQSKEQPDKYLFTEDPLPLDALQAADIDLQLNHKRLRLDRVELLDVATTIKLDKGNLRLSNTYLGPEGGRSSTRLGINAANQPVQFDVDMRSRDLRLNLMSGDIGDKSLIPKVDISVALKAVGDSPRAMASSSNGRILITLGSGQIVNSLVGWFTGDLTTRLFGLLNPFAEKEENTTLDCMIVGMDITDGDLDISGMLLQTEKIKAIGDGIVDLHTEEIQIGFKTQPRKGLGISASMFVTPFVRLDGTMAEPRLGVKTRSAFVAGAAAIATGGLSLFAQGAADRRAGAEGECLSLIEAVGGHPPIE